MVVIGKMGLTDAWNMKHNGLAWLGLAWLGLAWLGACAGILSLFKFEYSLADKLRKLTNVHSKLC